MSGRLVLDHVFCLVPPDGDGAARLAQAGWRLDDGTRHAGQGTRNRRLEVVVETGRTVTGTDLLAVVARP